MMRAGNLLRFLALVRAPSLRASLALLAAAAWISSGCSPLGSGRGNHPRWRMGKVDRGDILATVSATGTLNAVTTVQVGSQVSGNIMRLHADFNSRVKAGQLVAEIDPATFKAAVDQATADVLSARTGVQVATTDLLTLQAAVDVAKADVQTAEAAVRKAEVNLHNQDLSLARTQGLAQRKFVAQQDLDTATTNRNAAAADVASAHAQVAAASAKVETAQANRAEGDSKLEATRAQLAQRTATQQLAQVNLDRCKIYSPIDGVVVSRSVDVGQTVAASFSAPVLFTIANDLRNMQIDANVDEADIGRVREGQTVEFTVDAYPDDRFKGTVVQIRLQPIVSQNVVTYDTVIRVVNDQLLLRPGMTANVYVQVGHAKGVLRVPNAAFSFRPPATDGTVPAAPAPQKGVRTVYSPRRGAGPEAVQVKVGLSDGTLTELTDASLEDGDRVIIGSESEDSAGASGPTNPFMPRRGGR